MKKSLHIIMALLVFLFLIMVFPFIEIFAINLFMPTNNHIEYSLENLICIPTICSSFFLSLVVFVEYTRFIRSKLN